MASSSTPLSFDLIVFDEASAAIGRIIERIQLIPDSKHVETEDED